MSKNLVDVFIAETVSNINKIEDMLLEIHQSDEYIELLSGIYRCIHTIKGSSGIIRCNVIKESAHVFETAIQLFIDKKIKPDNDIIDILLSSCDLIRSVIDNFDNHKSYAKEHDKISKNIIECLNNYNELNFDCEPVELKSKPLSKKNKNENCLIFSSGCEFFGAVLNTVVEVLSEIKIKPILFSESYVLGVANYHGELLTLIDFNKRFSLYKNHNHKNEKIIVFKLKEMKLGVKVDSLNCICKLPKENKANLENLLFKSFCDYCFTYNGKLINALNIHALFF